MWSQRVLSIASSPMYVNNPSTYVDLSFCIYTVDIKKVSHTRYRALVPELIPVYRQSVRR